MGKLVSRSTHIDCANIWHVRRLTHRYVHADNRIGVEISLARNRVNLVWLQLGLRSLRLSNSMNANQGTEYQRRLLANPCQTALNHFLPLY